MARVKSRAAKSALACRPPAPSRRPRNPAEERGMSRTLLALVVPAAAAGCAGPIVRSVRANTPVPLAVPPQIIHRAFAEYPGLAKLPGKDVEVVMNVGVDADGVVRTVNVTRSGGSEFDQAARGALYKTRFSPGR